MRARPLNGQDGGRFKVPTDVTEAGVSGLTYLAVPLLAALWAAS